MSPEHRSDSLSAAFRNLERSAEEDLTQRYEVLCAHYGMTPTRNKPGAAHENGAVEGPHAHLKAAIQQTLFCAVGVVFVISMHIGTLLTKWPAAPLEIEHTHLNPLPARRADDFAEHLVTVTRSGGAMLSWRHAGVDAARAADPASASATSSIIATSFIHRAASQWPRSTWSTESSCFPGRHTAASGRP